MKLGQVLSIEAGDFLPEPLAGALATLRASGSTMSEAQLQGVFRAEYGVDWARRFSEFDHQPMAAASIGQVHRARTVDGRQLALKVQFPGVAQSIDSDVDNLAALLSMARLLPDGIDARPLLAEVKRQLRQETDYLAEGEYLHRYRGLVADMPAVRVPGIHRDLTTKRVLAMDLIDADPVETLWTGNHPQTRRDEVAALAQAIVFRELFEFGLMQSDPNFANYLYAPQSRQLVLLDFGSTIPVTDQLRDRYRTIVEAAVDDDLEAVGDHMVRFGWAPAGVPRAQVLAVAGLIHLSVEPLRAKGPYDYGATDLAARARDASLELALTHGVRHPPPPELVFVQRKLGGTFALCRQLGAMLDSGGMFRRFIAGEPLASLAPRSIS
jgi:predicted unusual protein kinase regulating ubiquinone biosynthesis (AarF/ABC1/UbiB family)